MTKKDYEAAASKLRIKRSLINFDVELDQCEAIEDFLVEFFREDNSRFNTETFRKACQS